MKKNNMTKTISIQYQGNLNCAITHEQSGTQWISAAPKDNNGDGSSFSPTDMLCASLASCYMTIMGIAARNHNIDLEGTDIAVTKHMADHPRRIGQIDIKMTLPPIERSEKEKKILYRAAESCPVSRSIHPHIAINFQLIGL